MLLSNDDFEYIRDLVRTHTGISLNNAEATKLPLLLASLIERTGLNSITELMIILRSSAYSQIHIQVIESLLVCETYFFRDIYPFEALQNFILPLYLKQRQRPLNIWSAACSSGQEAYSLAMLIHKCFPILCSRGLQIIASDVSSEMLSRAVAGCYSQKEVERGLPAIFLKRYFQKNEQSWVVKEEINRLIDFRQLNLVENWPILPQMDVIFMRNVLIYFDLETRKAILEKVRQLLRPDGYLFLGVAETTTHIIREFEPVQFNKTVCYRRKK
ncbi:protein-glutamate O-methyltransferase CheR [Ancylothrix sp. C2]|uniref:CheR family methyltransferase n=1 Tax=Ancylothrix sp. D3o TaxID=2953691 RepID=UPI0021BA5403|nr:protein-glutamate O-methyltransferase CheR [Ancylothrix sp. D3o]MCT7951605.1 protein-glutamate O-methyltransferase CheR [Ancylothrix sp. D3o]